MNRFYRYVENVLDGKIVVGEYVKLAVQRYINDRDSGHERGIYFDEQEAQRYLNAIGLFRHTQGQAAKERQRFNIQDHQAFYFGQLFGWKRDNGTRRFRTSYRSVARKNGKTEETGVIGAIGLTVDDEYGAEIYYAASKKEQAHKGFVAAQRMLRQARNESVKMRDSIEVQTFNIKNIETDSILKYVASDYDTMDGFNPHFAIIDEYHAHKTDGVYKVMETGMGARLQPLLAVITTAGTNLESPCYTLEKVCKDILRGIKHDDSVLVNIYTLDDGDDWEDEKVWPKSNPNLDVSVSMESLREQYLKAVNEGFSAQSHFRTKNLNTWMQNAHGWITDNVWMANGEDFDIDSLRGRTCYGGLDLASTRDLTALALVFPPEGADKKYRLLVYHFCPEEEAAIRSKNDFVDYLKWSNDGWMTLTPGNATDFDYLKHRLREINRIVNLRSIAYDPYNASQFVIQMTDEGFVMNEMRQGFLSISAPSKEFEKMLLNKRILHNNNPVLRWEIANVVISIDPAENIKPDKKKSTEKIDGVVASVMAIAECMDKGGTSIYEGRGIRSI